MSDRLIRNAEVLDIKAATERALTLAGGGANFQFCTRVRPTQLHRYHHTEEPDVIPLDVAVELDRRAGRPVLLETFARLLGCRVEPPEADGTQQTVEDAVGAAIRECGEAHCAALQANADNVVTIEEARITDREIDEAIAALMRVKATTRARVRGMS